MDLKQLEKQPYPAYLTPDGLVEVIAAHSGPQGAQLDYSLAVNDNSIARYHRPNGFTRLGNAKVLRLLSGWLLPTQCSTPPRRTQPPA